MTKPALVTDHLALLRGASLRLHDARPARPGFGMPQRLAAFPNHFPEEENADRMAGAERRQSRGHKFARYADHFIVLVKSACRNVSAADDADLAGTVTQRQILDWVELAGE